MDVIKYKKDDENSEEQVKYTEKETLNSMTPIWKKKKSEVTKEEYAEFYKASFYDTDAPIKTISMSVEGAVDFKALLFVPEKAPYNYYSKQYEKGLKLYTNGVMIMEKCADLLPDYFSFVKGVVDSELELNVSRETVQQSRSLKAISQSIEKKVKAELLDLQKNNREDYEKFYSAFGLQLKYGIYSTWGMSKEVLQDLLLFYSLKNEKLVTLKEYVSLIKEGEDSIYYVTGKTIDAVKNLPKTEKMLDDGYDVLCMTDEVDEFAIKFIQEYDGKKFKNITTEDSISADETVTENEKDVISFIKETLGDKVSKVVGTKSLKNHAVCLSSEGEVSIEMERVLSNMPNAENAVKAQKVLEVNIIHPVFDKMKALYDTDKETLKLYVEVLLREASLIAGLPIDNLSKSSSVIFDLLSK